MPSEDFNWCHKAWINGIATKEKLQIWVRAGRITQEEYEDIINTDVNDTEAKPEDKEIKELKANIQSLEQSIAELTTLITMQQTPTP